LLGQVSNDFILLSNRLLQVTNGLIFVFQPRGQAFNLRLKLLGVSRRFYFAGDFRVRSNKPVIVRSKLKGEWTSVRLPSPMR